MSSCVENETWSDGRGGAAFDDDLCSARHPWQVTLVLESCQYARLRFGVATGPVALSWMSGQHATLVPFVAAFGDVVNTGPAHNRCPVQ